MADVLVLLMVIGFFALCVALVRGCDRLIGPDEAHDLDAPEPSEAVTNDADTVEVAR